ncbi:MAG TPA: wax ester/triacylglycerol synthase family O-acyltransferase [Frankiaceae bacterium]|nr:wax ester/triacylglycerol synthase family O-acyltransferase [Frankiaceae bacterium]
MPIDAHMREIDSFSWSMERDPLLRMPIVAVALLDGAADATRLTARLDRLTRAVPMFRQRVVETPLRLAPPKWVVDPDFDLSWHVRRVGAPSPGTFAAVLDLARQFGTAAFDPVRPLWECTLVDGIENGRSALIIKVHHTLTDGVGGMQLLLHVFDLSVEGTDLGAALDPPPPGEVSVSILDALTFDTHQTFDVARSVAGTLLGAVRRPRSTATRLVGTARSVAEVLAPANQLLSPVMTRRGLGRRYDTIDVPLEQLRQAGRVAGGTVNDAFLGAVTGGLRRYHEQHGKPVERLRATFPISVRAADDPEEGNRIALVRYVVPVGIADPVERIQADQERAEHWKHAPALPHMEGIAGTVNRLPAGYLQGLAKHVDFVASNVPGFPFPVFCAGAPLVGFYPFSPTGGSAVNVTLLSYRDTCNIGVNSDVLAVPDGAVFLSCLQAGFDEVLALADREAAGREVKVRSS